MEKTDKNNNELKELLKWYHKKLIPLVGEDCFQIQGHEEGLQTYIVDCFLRKFPKEAAQLTEHEKKLMKTRGYYGMTLLRQTFSKDFEFYYGTFLSGIKDKITLHPSVEAYLKASAPTLILTTSICDVLDKSLSGYKSQYFYPMDVNFQKIDVPSICHVFGKAPDAMTAVKEKGVIGEEELLEFLNAWNNPKALHDTFLQRFHGCGLLVLGCDSLPNWIFRFLWYPVSKSEAGKGFFLDDDRPSSDDDVNPEAPSQSHSFSDFLHRIQYETSTTMFQLLKDVAVELKDSTVKPAGTTHHDFFISYASEDYTLAKTIANELTAHGLDVWLDKERPLELDGRYWTGIESAIRCSTYVMPIVTRHYVERFFSEKRMLENIKSALEEETERFTLILLERFNDDEDKLSKHIIPILKRGETASIIEKRRPVQVALTPEIIDQLCYRNPNFSIFDHINFKFFDESNPSDDSFHKTDWSNYKTA